MATITPVETVEGVVVRCSRPSQFVQHELSWTATPYLCCVGRTWIFRTFVALRDLLLKNRFLSYRIPFPCYRAWHRLFTLGELIVFTALLVSVGSVLANNKFLTVKFGWSKEDSGHVAEIPAVLRFEYIIQTFTLANRNSIWTLLFGVPFERSLKWHKLAGTAAIILGWWHGFLSGKSDEDEEGEDEDEEYTGILLASSMTLLLIVALWPVTRHFFNGFYFAHIALTIGTLCLAVLHEAPMLLLGACFWLFDILVRYVYMAMLRNPTKCTATRLPAHVTRLTFPKGSLDYNMGQYVFIMVPKLNVFEWHPFSLSSSPHHHMISIHIRILGNWTRNLHKMISESRASKVELTLYIDGPYGAPEIDIDSGKYKMFLLISGGIGVTPIQSVCNYLLHLSDTGKADFKQIWFIWSCADKFMVNSVFEHDRDWQEMTAAGRQRLPNSFQPDSLQRLGRHSRDSELSDEDVLTTSFYLTRLRDQSDFEAANIRPGLQPFVTFGRANLDAIFQQMERYASRIRERRVAVMCCGPQQLMNDVRIFSSAKSSGQVAFDFHGEMFNF